MQLPLSTKWLIIVLALFLVGPVSSTRGDDEPKSVSDKTPAEPKVTKLSGVFEAVQSAEITADTEHLSGLKLKRVLDQGAKVKKGQNVAWFQTEDIDKQLRKAERDHQIAKLDMETDEFAYQQFLDSQKLDRASADRTRKTAQQTFDNFVQVDRERRIESAKQSLKSSISSLENAKEELKQLTQMYEEDDLTEESEEIVLKRAKRSVESAEFRLEGTEISTNRIINQSIPRDDKDQHAALERAQMAHTKAIRDLQVARQKRDIEMDQKRESFKEKEKKLKELKAERSKIVLQSPIDGIVLHGKLNRGKLSDKPSTLKEDSPITGTQVIATIVNPSKLQIRVDVMEKDFGSISVGQACKITPSAFPKTKLDGTIKSISNVPYAGTKYDCVVSIRGKVDRVLPSMTCQIEISQDVDGEDDKTDE